MATINQTTGETTLHPAYRPIVYELEARVDLTEAARIKGSALAAGDVIEAVRIPSKSVVLTAGIEVLDAVTGATVLTLHLGTGRDNDSFVVGFDAFAAVSGDMSVNTTPTVMELFNYSDTLDLVIGTKTGNITAGAIRVFAVVASVVSTVKPGIAQLKS